MTTALRTVTNQPNIQRLTELKINLTNRLNTFKSIFNTLRYSDQIEPLQKKLGNRSISQKKIVEQLLFMCSKKQRESLPLFTGNNAANILGVAFCFTKD